MLTSEEKEYFRKQTPIDILDDSLRIKFACAALSGLMADHTVQLARADIADICWSMADAMLEKMHKPNQ